MRSPNTPDQKQIKMQKNTNAARKMREEREHAPRIYNEQKTLSSALKNPAPAKPNRHGIFQPLPAETLSENISKTTPEKNKSDNAQIPGIFAQRNHRADAAKEIERKKVIAAERAEKNQLNSPRS